MAQMPLNSIVDSLRTVTSLSSTMTTHSACAIKVRIDDRHVARFSRSFSCISSYHTASLFPLSSRHIDTSHTFSLLYLFLFPSHTLCLNISSYFSAANLRISDMTLAEVRKLTFKDASNSSERVPTLTQALQLAKKNSTTTRLIKVFVEIKCVEMWGPSAKLLAEKVAEVFKAENAHSFACVISFNPLVMYWLRVMDPIVECCMLYSTDFFASCIRHKLEKVPVWLPHIVWLLDPLLMQLCIRFFPELIGCTMVGPEAKIVSVADLKAYERRNLGVYVWVTNSLPEAAWYAFFKASYGTDVVFPKLVGPVLPKAIDPFNAGSLLPAPVALASPVDVVSSSSSTSSSPPTSPSINYSEANLTFASADVKASDEAATATSMFVPVVA